MTRIARPVWLAALAGVLGACASNPVQPGTVGLGTPFDLHAGASAVVGDGLTVAFDRVKSDSRCPADAICISAGDAVVALALSREGSARAERDVHSDTGGSRTSYLDYTITLQSLTPYPLASKPTRPEDYAVRLVVTK